jgi:hypothetical protein
MAICLLVILHSRSLSQLVIPISSNRVCLTSKALPSNTLATHLKVSLPGKSWQSPSDVRIGYPQSSTPQLSSATQAPNIPGSMMSTVTGGPNMMAQQAMAGNLAQQAQMQNAAQAARPGTQPQPIPAMSPKSQQRERARVTVLLEINTALLQEVVSLQQKGMAGTQTSQPQQSPNSPTSGPDSALNNSPTDPSKPGKPASQEYNDCMRRLQANLSYLATIADAKKKAGNPMPPGPAIMIPPAHLTSVHDLYKRLNQLFPDASQSTLNKAMAFASAQGNKQGGAVTAG